MPKYYNTEKVKKLLSKKAAAFSTDSVHYHHLNSFALNLSLDENIEKQELINLITVYNNSGFDSFSNLIDSINLFNELDSINDEEKESQQDLTADKQGVDIWLNIMDGPLGREQLIKIKQTDTIHDIKEKIQREGRVDLKKDALLIFL
jgi:hypothetical protein